MFNLIGKHSDQRINQIANSLIKSLQEAALSGEMYVGYPIFYDPISCNEVRIDILVVSYSGVVIINYIDDVTLDYTELQDRLYNKVDSKLRNYDFLVKKRKLFFDISQVTYSEKKIQPIDEYNIVFDCHHPKAHCVFSNVKDCRIPMKSVLSLGQFVDFIFRQFYHVELPEFDMVKFDETITQAESKMIHINW